MKEIIKNILKEALFTQHLGERFYSRFLNFEPKQIGYEERGSIGDYIPLGEKVLERSVVENIKNKLDKLFSLNFPTWKSYAIKLADLSINPQTDKKIYWEFDGADKEAIGKTLIYLDNETNSNGNIIYAIIRDNKVMTIFFAKSYSRIDKNKLKVDMIIDEFENIYNLGN
jgi:hypothetical protein